MPEKTNSGWGLYTVRKLIEYVGIALALWQLGIPAAEKYIDNRITNSTKGKMSFRSELSNELKIPEDRIHIEISDWIHSMNELNTKVAGIIPHIEEEIRFVHPRLVIKPQGEFWIDSKGVEHRVHRIVDGTGMYFDDNQWKHIFR